MLRGRTELSAGDLSGCFDWAAAAKEFEDCPEVPRNLREIIEDESPETALSSEQRLHILEWATALTALPCSGLKEPIQLRLWADGDDGDLPNVHTCVSRQGGAPSLEILRLRGTRKPFLRLLRFALTRCACSERAPSDA